MFYLAVPVLMMGGFILFTQLGYETFVDELAYHLPSFKLFADRFPELPIGGYSVCGGPLHYILLALINQIIKLDLISLRVITLSCWALCVVMLLLGSTRKRTVNPVFLSLWVLGPYMMQSGLLYGSVGFALPCVLAIVLSAESYAAGNKRALIWLILSLVLVSWIRQSELYFLIPSAFLLFCNPERSKRFNVLWLALPVMTLIPVYLSWHGLTPPAFQQYYANFSKGLAFTQTTLSLFSFAIFLFPLGFRFVARLKWKTLLFLPVGLLPLFFPLPYTEVASGIVVRLLIGLDAIHPTIAFIAQTVIPIWGAICLASLWQTDRIGRFCMIAVLAGEAMLLLNSVNYERHHYSLYLPVFLLAARSRNINRWETAVCIFITLSITMIMLFRIANNHL